MSVLTAKGFTDFFKEVHDSDPFKWQKRLLENVLQDEKWPDQLDLPTGAGKTSALDIAIYTLAAKPEKFGRRIVFVVDRRLIVDQVSQRARKISQALRNPKSQILKDVSKSLYSLMGIAESTEREETFPLGVDILRGGVGIDRSWAARPDQPRVMVSTVDQVGSRLLFRGYGTSDSMKPIEAGLLGQDCLFLLDEVHISQPFAETLRSLQEDYDTISGGLPSRWQVVEMSATLTSNSKSNKSRPRQVFSLQDDESDPAREPELGGWLTAQKHLKIELLKTRDKFPVQVVKFLKDMDGISICIVVNRVETARLITEELQEKIHDDVCLLTGRMRALERADLMEQIINRVESGENRDTSSESRIVVVATQCVEVGADFDFEGMITECASIDALKQRFGRVDRRGRKSQRGTPAGIIVVGIENELKKKEGDPIYGEALKKTWEELQKKPSHNVGPLSPEFLKLGKKSDLHMNKEQSPLLGSIHLDTLVQTYPKPRIGPEIDLWLHGMTKKQSDVQLVWRADITQEMLDESKNEVLDLLSLCPPRSIESLSVPINSARSWLRNLSKEQMYPSDSKVDNKSKSIDLLADIANQIELEEEYKRDREKIIALPVVKWRGKSRSKVTNSNDIYPGDLLVIPSEYGGCKEMSFSSGENEIKYSVWSPSHREPVSDIGDRAQFQGGSKVTLRLNENLLPKSLKDVPRPSSEEDEDTADRENILIWLQEHIKTDVNAGWATEILEHLYSNKETLNIAVVKNGMGKRFLLSCPSSARQPDMDSGFLLFDLDGSDEANSFTEVDTPILLKDHLMGVGDIARQFAENCFLSKELIEDLTLAGRLHDAGKADPRFQLWLHDADDITRRKTGELIAKSKSRQNSKTQREKARDVSRYPKGARHELLSVALAESAPEILGGAHDSELVLHLVASHHGYCRPLAPAAFDDNPQEIKYEWIDGTMMKSSTVHNLEKINSGIVDRFWNLVRRYGWHGLAWLEAILRLADHRRSELEACSK